MEILLIRHGDPDYEADTLTELGNTEARLLAERLTASRVDAIYYSPLGRARDTMRYTAAAAGVEPVVCDWMREVWAPAVELHGEHVLGESALPEVGNWHEHPLFGKDLHHCHLEISKGFDDVLKSRGYEKSGNVYLVRHHSEERIVFFRLECFRRHHEDLSQRGVLGSEPLGFGQHFLAVVKPKIGAGRLIRTHRDVLGAFQAVVGCVIQ